MKIGAAYIRVSTDRQLELSPASQLKLVKEYAKAHDIILNEQYIFSDDGISGRTVKKRLGFQHMIALAKSKPRPFDVILVWKFSRFARSREDSVVYKSLLKKDCGIEVVSISEPVGEDKSSILMEALFEAMDEYYSINLSEEVKRGMTQKASQGGVVNSPPFGYKMKEGEFVPDEHEAPIVKMIFEKYLNGAGTRAIAMELNDLGIKTKKGKNFANRNIEYILSNNAYIGKVKWTPTGTATTSHRYVATEDTIITDGKHEPIVEKHIFEDVQKLLAEKKAKYPKHYNQRSEEYFFRGMIRCSNCGATLTLSVKGLYLQCYKYSRGECKESHCISLEKLKQAVITDLTDAAKNPNAKLSFDKRIPVVLDNDGLIYEQIKREEVKLARIKDAYADGIDTLEEYKANKNKILKTIESLKSKLDNSSVAVEIDNEKSIEEFRNKIFDVVNVISSPDVSPADFNSALFSVISRIVFDRKKCSIQVFYKV